MSVEVARRGYWSNRWQVCCMGGSLAGCYGGPGCNNREEGGEVEFLQRSFGCGVGSRCMGRSCGSWERVLGGDTTCGRISDKLPP